MSWAFHALPKQLTGWSYRVGRGTFRITEKWLLGLRLYSLTFDNIELGSFTYADLAADSIVQGEHDERLGFAASKEIPSRCFGKADPDKWMPATYGPEPKWSMRAPGGGSSL